MGRYYTGDIEGKFWFGVQSSDDAEQFGSVECTTVSYNVYDNEACREGLREVFAELGIGEDFAMDPGTVCEAAGQDDDQSDERQRLYASLELGLKIYQCVERQGHCNFEAEC